MTSRLFAQDFLTSLFLSTSLTTICSCGRYFVAIQLQAYFACFGYLIHRIMITGNQLDDSILPRIIAIIQHCPGLDWVAADGNRFTDKYRHDVARAVAVATNLKSIQCDSLLPYEVWLSVF
jgi:hypothetical protein